MQRLAINDVVGYVEQNISGFHEKRLNKIKSLKLNEILKKKNPYLFKAKNLHTADEIVKSIISAYLSSSEETMFGDWLEGLVIFINEKVYGGRKSGIKGIDLEFDKNEIRYLVSIKSGPNWGNASQIEKMITNFKTAKKTLRTSNSQLHITCVNGCCYGIDNNPEKGDYLKLCGQNFWEFISGDETLYTDIIEPLGHNVKSFNDDYQNKLGAMTNKFMKEFLDKYCDKNGIINWEQLVKYNSGK